jgi:hypothetical protein
MRIRIPGSRSKSTGFPVLVLSDVAVVPRLRVERVGKLAAALRGYPDAVEVRDSIPAGRLNVARTLPAGAGFCLCRNIRGSDPQSRTDGADAADDQPLLHDSNAPSRAQVPVQS